MSMPKVFRRTAAAAAAILLVVWTGCASAPAKAPAATEPAAPAAPTQAAPETAPPVTQAVTPPADQPEAAPADTAAVPAAGAPVTDEELQTVQAAIAEAEAAEADTYSPGPLNAARQGLADARPKGAAEPDAARALLADALTQAHLARDTALKARLEALLAKIDQAVGRWNAVQGPDWDPEADLALLAQAGAAKDAVTADYTAGKPQADEALAALDAAVTRVADRLTALLTLRSDAQKALDEADAAEAYVWVPDQVETANGAFFQGTAAYKKFQGDAAEEAWNTALFEARSAVEKSQQALARKQTEQLMLDTMKKLEHASGKTIVDPNDNIIAPEPWDGRKELEKLQAKPVSLVIPTDGSVVVLGEKQRVTYLDDAKAQWAAGVEAMNVGDLTLANESFLQAQKLIDTYLAMAVDKIYTVRLIPERRDSLWRISEYGDIFGTPWDWPKIWRRNQKLIQNPDLIYPGWQLIIPPQ